MESLLEQQRRYHEERERLIEAMTKESLLQKKTVSTVFVSMQPMLLVDASIADSRVNPLCRKRVSYVAKSSALDLHMQLFFLPLVSGHSQLYKGSGKEENAFKYYSKIVGLFHC